MKPQIMKMIGKEIVLFDGAMGTQLQAAGFGGEGIPEALNIENPELIQSIHAAYLEAGSDIITTNTFGANRLKTEPAGYRVSEIVFAAVQNAKNAIRETGRQAYIALDLGPTGKMIDLLDGISFEDVYDLYREQATAGEQAGADLILFETFGDLSELKAGILAVKENTQLPIFCSLTFEEDGRTLMGADVETAVFSLQDMGLAAIGINCSLGPKETFPLFEKMASISKIPVFVQPNAGLPRQEGDQTIFDVDVASFLESMKKMLDVGAALIGGCCGTTPEYIAALRAEVDHLPNAEKPAQYPALNEAWVQAKLDSARPSCCSLAKAVCLGDRVRIIGERINPTGKKVLKQALIEENYEYVEDEAVTQLLAGADIIGVNAGLPDIEEGVALSAIISRLSKRVNMPLLIDCKVPEYLEAAVRACRGKPIINSVTGEQENMDAVFPIVQKYGTAVIALTLDENGIPKTAEDRIDILKKILKEAGKYGITKDRIIVDPLALTVSAEADGLQESMKALRMAKERFGVCTTLGASNVSYGLPMRPVLNASFLSMAVYAGLDAPITDPTSESYMDAIRAAEVLTGKDAGADDFVRYSKRKNEDSLEERGTPTPSVSAGPELSEIILGGFEDKAVAATEVLLKTKSPLEIIDDVIVPTMEQSGILYEKGITFLPQMIRSADTVKKAFEVLKVAMDKEGGHESAGRIALATVKGDIHDIGKNIVKSMLENYGYEIIDLGKDVPPEVVVRTVKEEGLQLVGLSALMTTTIRSMKETIRQIREANLPCKIMVGGAVLTEEYAARIGADYYCANAVEGVRVAKAVLKGENK